LDTLDHGGKGSERVRRIGKKTQSNEKGGKKKLTTAKKKKKHLFYSHKKYKAQEHELYM